MDSLLPFFLVMVGCHQLVEVCVCGHACVCMCKVFQRAHWESSWVGWRPLSLSPHRGGQILCCRRTRRTHTYTVSTFLLMLEKEKHNTAYTLDHSSSLQGFYPEELNHCKIVSGVVLQPRSNPARWWLLTRTLFIDAARALWGWGGGICSAEGWRQSFEPSLCRQTRIEIISWLGKRSVSWQPEEPTCPSRVWDPFCHSQEGGCDRAGQRGAEWGGSVGAGSQTIRRTWTFLTLR